MYGIQYYTFGYMLSIFFIFLAFFFMFDQDISRGKPRREDRKKNRFTKILENVDGIRIEDNTEHYLNMMTDLSGPRDDVEDKNYDRILNKLMSDEDKARRTLLKSKKNIASIVEEKEIVKQDERPINGVYYAIYIFSLAFIVQLVYISRNGF